VKSGPCKYKLLYPELNSNWYCHSAAMVQTDRLTRWIDSRNWHAALPP